MSKEVKVLNLTPDNATLLLAAAVELGEEIGVVKTSSFGHFLVPEEVAKKAGLDYESDEADEKPAAKKTVAKKTAAKE